MKTAGTKIATVTSVGRKAIPSTCVRVKPEAAKPEAAKTENGNRKVIQSSAVLKIERREFIMWMLEMLVKVMRLNLTLTLSWDCIPCLKKGNIPNLCAA